ncbi:MAG: hypothetical protein K5647_09550 [Clostridiales bacterium]|nr:hypothetical protein [Clostridiales bacterium]
MTSGSVKGSVSTEDVVSGAVSGEVVTSVTVASCVVSGAEVTSGKVVPEPAEEVSEAAEEDSVADEVLPGSDDETPVSFSPVSGKTVSGESDRVVSGSSGPEVVSP